MADVPFSFSVLRRREPDVRGGFLSGSVFRVQASACGNSGADREGACILNAGAYGRPAVGFALTAMKKFFAINFSAFSRV